VGFHVVDRFAQEHTAHTVADGMPPKERRKFKALYSECVVQLGGESAKVYLVKPQTFMNLSGSAVRDLLKYYGESLDQDLSERLLVIHDDLDLPEGKLRFRQRGSAGGHRGVASVISHLGHDRFSRLKIGIGRREGVESTDYVLEAVDSQTRALFDLACEEAAASLIVWLRDGVESSMNQFNASSPPSGEKPDAGVSEL